METSGAPLHARRARQVHEAGLDRESWRDHRWWIMLRRDPPLAPVSRRIPMLTTLRSLRPSRLFAALAVLVLSACAVQPLTENIAPPRFVVGDHWEYLVTDGLRRGATTRLDVQVVAINAGVATMRLVSVDSYGRSEQTEEIDADGGLRSGALRDAEVRR